MNIISTQMSSSIENGSWIRRMFEAGIQLKQKYGNDAVCDFSLGNPDLAPPPAVGKALAAFAQHVDEPFSLGYMPNAGFGWAREKLAAHISKEQGVDIAGNDVILTCGAAGALNVIFKAVLEPGDEVLSVTPYFVEYGSYVNNHGGVFKKVATLPDTFGLDLPAIEAAITPKTRAMIINSPTTPPATSTPGRNWKGWSPSSPRRPNATGVRSTSSRTSRTASSPSTAWRCRACCPCTPTPSSPARSPRTCVLRANVSATSPCLRFSRNAASSWRA